jgi:hypothetical protein
MKYEETWVKVYRGKAAEELMAASPRAYLLLNQIAMRAQRTNTFNRYDLDVGEALLGDFASLKMTEGQYRAAKKFLKKHSFATFRTTNKGTIAKLINTEIFDPNLEVDDEPSNDQISSKQRTANDPTTTTNNVKKENKAKNGKSPPKSSNGEMPKGVRAIALENLIKEKKKEAEDYKHQNRGEAAGGEYVWAGDSKEVYQEMSSKIKELESDRESMLFPQS